MRQRRIRIKGGEAQIVGIHSCVGEDDDASPHAGPKTEKAFVAAGSTVMPNDSLIGRYPGQPDVPGLVDSPARLLREFHRLGQGRLIDAHVRLQIAQHVIGR